MGRKSLPLLPVFLLWLAVSAILIWSGLTQITTLSGWDPDDQLRLVQLRDFLAGQSWFDTAQYRMNAPAGAPMHWSRLTELPLALIVILLTPLTGQPAAEMFTGAAIPLLLLGGHRVYLGTDRNSACKSGGRVCRRFANADFASNSASASANADRPSRLADHACRAGIMDNVLAR